MGYSFKEDGDSVIALISGKFSSLQEVNDLVTSIDKKVHALEKSTLVLDLKDCDHLTSSIMAFMVSWEKNLKEKGKALAIVNAPEFIIELLKACRLEGIVRS